MDSPSLHIAMFPWFAIGHLTPYLHLSNKLAKRGHRVSFFIPKRTQAKLEQFNLYPHLITFYPINVPHVDGLPHGAETTSDVSFPLVPLIMTAMDRTENDIELLLLHLKPQIVFFDFTYWLPNMTRRLGIKSFQYSIIGPATVSYVRSPARMRQNMTETDLMQPPEGYPVSSIKLHAHEAKFLASKRDLEFGSGVLFYHRLNTGLMQSDAIGFKGPVLPEPPNTVLDEKWGSWLAKFKEGSVIYCALGSEWKLPHDQFQELLLGLELTNLPFLAVLKTPVGFETIEAALPEGFKERDEGRGIVHSGWIQQQLILEHPSVGCFITHCGAGSLTEALVNKCQIVLLPQLDADHIINARTMATNKVGVEVEKGEEDGFFTKESACKAVKIVMNEENEVGREVRTNHDKVRNFLLSHNLESAYVDSFCQKLRDLLR
uniref:Anthocyanidin 3-O-glucosyltransferase n=1 Tax=Cajanus cajan TaxID=3821 RepID=A0A151RR96_CAJCA|nr:Anthocyanidin 3-O-glucosyltransferase [Cajanus cajan]